MPGARRDLAVDVQGLAELRRSLRRLEDELDPRVVDTLKQIGRPVQEIARRLARKRTEPPRRGERVGTLSRSIRMSVTQGRVSIYSNEVYAAPQEYGGTVGPGKHSYIPPKRFMERAVQGSRDDTARRLQHLLDEIALDFER